MIHRRKFFLIFGHDITAVHSSIVVKIICTGGHIPDVRSLQLFYGEIKKCPVIGFEFNLSVRNQNLIVAFEVFSRSKSSSGVSCLWPRIGKVQVDSGNFILSNTSGKVAASIQINRKFGTSSSSFSTARRRTLE